MTAIAACRMCGTEPLENARFCHSCGLPVDDSDAHAEYKQVTVLFAGRHSPPVRPSLCFQAATTTPTGLACQRT
jgi:hypothetical protein